MWQHVRADRSSDSGGGTRVLLGILAANASMRRLEIKHLRRQDLDLETRVLHICRSKNQTSHRVLPLNAPAKRRSNGCPRSGDSKAVDVTINIRGPLPQVLGDRDRLLQVLTNLLDNALKFTPSRGTIQVWAETFGHNVRISVADSGSGIPEEQITELFRPFWRPTQATTVVPGWVWPSSKLLSSRMAGASGQRAVPNEAPRSNLILQTADPDAPLNQS